MSFKVITGVSSTGDVQLPASLKYGTATLHWSLSIRIITELQSMYSLKDSQRRTTETVTSVYII